MHFFRPKFTQEIMREGGPVIELNKNLNHISLSWVQQPLQRQEMGENNHFVFSAQFNGQHP